jgi:Protein of unknown function (DUF3592)
MIPSIHGGPPTSTAGKSYEAWKESVMNQAEDTEAWEDWNEESSAASGPVLRRQGALGGHGLAALLAGVGLLLASAIVLLPKFRHLTQGERTVGIVEGYKNYGYGLYSGSYRAPIVRYSAKGDGVHDTLGSLPAARSFYPTGKEVWVLYLRNEPRNAVIADFPQLFMIPTVVGGVGLILLIGTSVFMYWTVRSELPTNMSVPAVNDAAKDDTAKDNAADDDDPECPGQYWRSDSHHDQQRAEAEAHAPDSTASACEGG